jgi:hypothetical protein
MQEKDFDTLAGLMADIIIRNKPAGDDVARYRKSFLTMGFTLPTAEALPLAARILSTVLPDPSYAAAFAENLRRAAGAHK